MTALQMMAWFVIVLSAVKILVVAINPKAWMDNVAKPLYTHAALQWTFLAIAVLGWYELRKTMSYEQLFAAMFVFMFLYAAAFAPYGKDVLGSLEHTYKNKAAMWKKSWPSVVVWVVLLVLAAKALLA